MNLQPDDCCRVCLISLVLDMVDKEICAQSIATIENVPKMHESGSAMDERFHDKDDFKEPYLFKSV